jgi:pimeloyl-ACP methyl ester carboxylesterase
MSFTVGTDAYARHVGRYGAALSAAHADAADLMRGDRAIPRATLRVIANAGHVSNMERPQEFTALVRRFARSN